MDAGHCSLAEKAAIFKKLRAPVADDDFDAHEIDYRQRTRGFFKTKVSTPTATNDETSALQEQSRHVDPRRVSSAPTPGQQNGPKIIKGTPASETARKSRLDTLLDGEASGSSLGRETVIPDSTRSAIRALQRSDSTPLPAAKHLMGNQSAYALSRAGVPKRRKRNVSPVKRPEGDLIFKDLAFFYVPDDDIAPARRIRISKAKEYGVMWTRNVSAATHVVVDRSIHYRDVESILSRANKDRPPKVVNEDYPIDCIQFKAMLDHNQKKYQLAGQPVVGNDPRPAEPPPSSDESTTSLQLKPPQNNPRRWDYGPPLGTPSRSDESSQASRVAGTPAPTDSQPINLDLDPVAASPGEEPREVEEVPPRSVEISAIGEGDGVTHPGGSQISARKDELSDYISMMQGYKDLPLDVEEEDDPNSAVDPREAPEYFEEKSGSDDERTRQRHRTRATTRRGCKDMRFEDRFACNQAGAKGSNADNPNARTIEILQSMANYYDQVNDHWRTTAYRKAISTLKRQNVKITTEEEAFQLPMIGQRLAQKIEEIVTTDRLRRLEYAEAEPMSESLRLFMQIYGVGTRQAQQWIAQGFRTLEDVKHRAKLSANQLLGIEHYGGLNTRIPRQEVEALGAVVRKAAAQIDPQTELIIGGSYRRGAESSHDIDFIVTKPSTESTAELLPFLGKLVQRLEKNGFLVARLASSRAGQDGSKWHGCCVLPKIKGLNDDNYRPIWRRIDFLLVPESEMGAALIYFTGNDIFNRSMRLLASKKGMRLNQRGLYKDVLRGPGRAKLTEGKLVEGRDEKKIFEILGVEWREPHERWC